MKLCQPLLKFHVEANYSEISFAIIGLQKEMILSPSRDDVVARTEKEMGRLEKDVILASLSPVNEQSSRKLYILQ